MDVNKTSTLIAVCERLLKMKLGDKARLQTIKARAEQGRVLYALDKKYVEKMAAYIKYEEIPQESPPPRPEPVVEEQVVPEPVVEVVPPRPEPKQQSSFCGNCGKDIPPSNNFCTNCGAKKVSVQPQQDPSQPPPPNYTRTSKKQSLEEYEKGYLSRVNAGEPAPNEQPRMNVPPPSEHNINSGKVLQRPPEWKSMGVTMVLALVLGIVGLGGIGQVYLGKIIRGIVFCIIGIILAVTVFISAFLALVIFIPFALIVLYDAYKLCKRYNDHLEQHGKPPW